MKYVIINSNEVSSINFSQVKQDSASTLRYNLDLTKTFVKFEGETPSFLSGKTQYINAQMLVMLNDVDGEWFYPEES